MFARNLPEGSGGQMETKTRTIIKSVTWSAIGWLVMAIVGFIATGSWSTGGGMATINTLIGFVTYLIYERFWSKVTWGRMDA